MYLGVSLKVRVKVINIIGKLRVHPNLNKKRTYEIMIEEVKKI